MSSTFRQSEGKKVRFFYIFKYDRWIIQIKAGVWWFWFCDDSVCYLDPILKTKNNDHVCLIRRNVTSFSRQGYIWCLNIIGTGIHSNPLHIPLDGLIHWRYTQSSTLDVGTFFDINIESVSTKKTNIPGTNYYTEMSATIGWGWDDILCPYQSLRWGLSCTDLQ